jgi:hypothetical protein
MKTIPLVILFADKNPGPGRRLRGELRLRGAHVLLAGSTEEAIHQAAIASPDILVMDDDLKLEGHADLGTFIHNAFPNAGIIFLHGRGQPTASPCGLDLLLWAHKGVDDQTLIETMEFAFPGRLGEPTADWLRARQKPCVDDEPCKPKSLTWFISRRGSQESRFKVLNGKAAVQRWQFAHRMAESGDGSTVSGPGPLDGTGVQRDSGAL